MHPSVALAALTVALGEPGSPLQILPAGEFRARDGRPADAPVWRLDAPLARRLIAAMRSQATRIAIDYEHQTLLAEKNGQPAPAAGWIDPADLEWVDGVGLMARKVEWTERAAAMLAAREYRYFSPVFEYAKPGGDVTWLWLGALTNNPGIDGMAAVALSALSLITPHQETPVNETLKKLLATLGLADGTSEEAALSAVTALKAQAGSVPALQTEVAALKAASAATPDPARYVPIGLYNEERAARAALASQVQGAEVARLIEGATAAGKLLPAQRAWAEELGRGNLAALKSYVETAPQVAPANGQTQTGGAAPAAGGAKPGALSEAELAVCKAMGIEAEAFLKTKEA